MISKVTDRDLIACHQYVAGGSTLLWTTDVFWKTSRDVALLRIHRVRLHLIIYQSIIDDQ